MRCKRYGLGVHFVIHAVDRPDALATRAYRRAWDQNEKPMKPRGKFRRGWRKNAHADFPFGYTLAQYKEAV
jgi:hypothetical protein